MVLTTRHLLTGRGIVRPCLAYALISLRLWRELMAPFVYVCVCVCVCVCDLYYLRG